MKPNKKVFYQINRSTECNALYPNLNRLSKVRRNTFGEKIEITLVGPVSMYNEARRKMRHHELIGLKQNGLFTMEDIRRNSRAKVWS